MAATLVFCGVIAAGACAPASAQFNQFEIKEPKVERGEAEVEYLGDYNFHPPRRRFVEDPPGPGAHVLDDNDINRQRHSLEIRYGFTKWLGLQVGVEGEQARFGDPGTIAEANAFDDLKLTEIQIEGTIVLVPAEKDGFSAAALIEYNVALQQEEADQLFLGAALKYARGPLSAVTNLYLVKNIDGGEDLNGARIRDERWDLHYAAQLKYQVGSQLAFALEGYGTVERLGNSGTKTEQRALFGDFDRHLLGPVLYYAWNRPTAAATAQDDDNKSAKKAAKSLRMGKGNDDGKSGTTYTMGAGVLFGLNENTSDVSLKWSLSVEF